jgi:hypothetical protein
MNQLAKDSSKKEITAKYRPFFQHILCEITLTYPNLVRNLHIKIPAKPNICRNPDARTRRMHPTWRILSPPKYSSSSFIPPGRSPPWSKPFTFPRVSLPYFGVLPLACSCKAPRPSLHSQVSSYSLPLCPSPVGEETYDSARLRLVDMHCRRDSKVLLYTSQFVR